MRDCIRISTKVHSKSNSHSMSDLVRSTQSDATKRSHHRSRRRRHRHLSKRQDRFNTVVHVPIQSSDKLSYSINRTPIQQQQRLQYVKECWLDGTAPSKDHHRNLKKHQKRICLLRYIAMSVLIVLIICIILAVILSIVLIKRNSTTKPSYPIAVLRWSTTGITLFGVSGMAGNVSNQLNLPKDAAFVYPNTLYIADTKNNRIQKYIIGDSVATTVAGQADATAGSSATYLDNPSCIRIDSTGRIYIADLDNNRVQLWPHGASAGETVAGNATTGPINAADRLSFPYGIERDINSGTLYVVDYGNARIMSYAPGASSGTVVAGGNGQGRNNTQLYNPIRVYFDSLSNSLVITNHAAHNIVRWVLGASRWTLLAGDPAGVLGSNSTQLRFPLDATFDPMGNMYVADKDNHRIQLFMAGQSEGITIAGITNGFGNSSTQLYQPWSVKLDNQLNLYVADSRNHRIQKFVRY